MDLQQPSLRKFAPAHRADLERIFDLANTLRTDETVERVVDSWARRYQLQPSPGQKLMMAQPLGLAAQFRALFREDTGKDSWFDADAVTSDGGTKLYSWNDRIDATHVLYQATSGAQCNLPAADASFANAKAAVFNGSSHLYVSTRAASAFTFLHDGTGMEVVGVFNIDNTANMVLWSTWPNASAGGGWHYVNLTHWEVRLVSADAILDCGLMPANVGTYSAVSFTTADSPQMRGYRKSAQVGTTAAGGPYATAPVITLRIGNLGPGITAGMFAGRLRALYLFRRVLNAAEKTTYRSFIQADTGIAP
jgi:hypothetical protein